MPALDAKTRNSISLSPSHVLSSSRLNAAQIPKLVLADALFVTSLYAGKEWILDLEVGVFWLMMRVLACGGVGVVVWEAVTGKLTKRRDIEWSVLGMASMLVFVQQACLLTALYRLSPFRALIFCRFSSLWLDALTTQTSIKRTLFALSAVVVPFLIDTGFSKVSFTRLLPGYAALVLHGVSSSALIHTRQVLTSSLGPTFTVAASTLGATVLALPIYLCRTVMLSFPTSPVLPILSLAAIPFLAYSQLYHAPASLSVELHPLSGSNRFPLTFTITVVLSLLFGPLAFSQYPSWLDIAAVGVFFYGFKPSDSVQLSVAQQTPTGRLLRSYLKTILSNAESRKIFYFLMLNMCYMLVQMLYGVWTNSLGLISDAIHMAFDCMAIGVGLFASVMATWNPNEQFSYGYGRIETLSGFANGIFLILISVFIVFEAIERIVNPPEMNTGKLLLVSSLGLAVNLFGMFAMGGHHHHGGHSHSHGHSHGSHSPASHSEHEGHSHSAPHVSAHPHSPVSQPNGHSHSHSPTADCDEHSHSPTGHGSHEEHSHSHEPHSHSHSYSHDSHGHSHSPIQEHHSHSHQQENHSHTHAHSPQESAHSHSPSHARAPSLRLNGHSHSHDQQEHSHSPLSPNTVSPLTPSYPFVDDHHLESHEHDHHHEHHEGHSHNMRGVFLHVMADTLGSVGVIVSTLLIQFYGWTGFDPIASLFIAILIAASVIPLVVDTGKVLALDVGDKSSHIERALAELPSIEGLASYSNPRFWPKDDASVVGSIHIQLKPSASSADPGGPHSSVRTTYAALDRVVERVDQLLRNRIPGLVELAIQAEKTGVNPRH